MNQEILVSLGREALLLMILASLPPVGASLLAGFIMSFLQTITQLQDTALSVVPKLCASVLALIIAGPWISSQLARFTTQLLLALAQVRS